jgi:Protein of unknown function (DUF1566)
MTDPVSKKSGEDPDQTLPASTRFIVLSNMASDAVLDRETGLVWQRAPEFRPNGAFWGLGSGTCMAQRIGGRSGWRLPTVQELASLIDPTATSGPPLPAGHPFIGVPAAAAYWTATQVDRVPERAVIIHWGIESFPTPHFALILNSEEEKNSFFNDTPVFGRLPLLYWCVRGQGGADAQ